jgi:pimeloyl-ACP methyl ester carboxylesterase
MLGSMHWFDALVPLLSEKFRIIRTDLLGHGSSSKLGKYSPEEQARAARSALDTIGVTRATVIGHSLGCDVAISLAEQGLSVSRVVIMSEAPDYTLARPPLVNYALLAPIFGPLLYRNLPDFAVRKAVSAFFAPGFPFEKAFDNVEQPIQDARAVPYDCFRDTQVEKERFVAEEPLDTRLRNLDIPSLVLFGEKDQIFDCAGSCRRYQAVRNATVEVIANVGHSPMLEDPRLTVQRLHAFLGEP